MDEPFFAAYLHVSGLNHPGRDETLAAHETDPVVVAKTCNRKSKKQFSFQKHMSHHMLPSFPLRWAAKAEHFFLIREPQRVIASYIKGRTEFKIEDLGFAAQRRVYAEIEAMTRSAPPIIDSLDILRSPEKALKILCTALNMPFDPAMLSWAAGPRPEDGAWAPYWYAAVEKSTGFAAPPLHMPDISAEHADMLAACQADYDYLYERRLQV